MIITRKSIRFGDGGSTFPLPPFYGYKMVYSRKGKRSGWRPGASHVILKLLIPFDATVICVHEHEALQEGRVTLNKEMKMRTDKVEVIAAFRGYKGAQIPDPENYTFFSRYDYNFKYVVGKTKRTTLDVTNAQCSEGIHFYLHRCNVAF